MAGRERKTDIPEEVIALGKRIEKVIREKELKTREVAHDANLDVENLRKYIKGRQEMKVTTLLKIARALEVKAGELLD